MEPVVLQIIMLLQLLHYCPCYAKISFMLLIETIARALFFFFFFLYDRFGLLLIINLGLLLFEYKINLAIYIL
jgi:hypothetical protein